MPEPIQFSPSIQAAMLPIDCNELQKGEVVMAVGNGVTNMLFPNYTDTMLRHGFAEIMPTDKCDEAYSGSLERDWSICAEPKKGQSPFHGDSGEF